MPIKKSTSSAKTKKTAPIKKSTKKKSSTKQAVKAKDEKTFDMEIPINKAIAENKSNVKKGIPHVKVDSVEVGELKEEDEDVISSINTADSDSSKALKKDGEEDLLTDQTEDAEEVEEVEEVGDKEEEVDETENEEVSVEKQEEDAVEKVIEKKVTVEEPLEEEVVEDDQEVESLEENLEDSAKEEDIDEDLKVQEKSSNLEENEVEEDAEVEVESESVEVQHIGDKKAPVQKATPKLATLSDLKSFGSSDDDSDDEEYEEEDGDDEEGGVSGFFTQEFAFGMSRGVILAIFIVLVVVLGFLYQRNISNSGSTPTDGVVVPTLIPVEGTEDDAEITTTPPESSAVDVPAILNEIAEFLVLPKETPTVAAIVDVEQLRVENPDFFADAKNGDILIVYENKQIAFIYRPSERKVIDFQPVVNNGAVEGEKTQITE